MSEAVSVILAHPAAADSHLAFVGDRRKTNGGRGVRRKGEPMP